MAKQVDLLDGSGWYALSGTSGGGQDESSLLALLSPYAHIGNMSVTASLFNGMVQCGKVEREIRGTQKAKWSRREVTFLRVGFVNFSSSATITITLVCRRYKRTPYCRRLTDNSQITVLTRVTNLADTR